jgi:hypothetical protein
MQIHTNGDQMQLVFSDQTAAQCEAWDAPGRVLHIVDSAAALAQAMVAEFCRLEGIALRLPGGAPDS